MKPRTDLDAWLPHAPAQAAADTSDHAGLAAEPTSPAPSGPPPEGPPARPFSEELSDADLERVAGGSWSGYWTWKDNKWNWTWVWSDPTSSSWTTS